MSELKQELLVNKTRLPQLPLDWVARQRLTSKLVEALQHKLVLLSAPAGYGKTTLIIEALRDYEKPTGWISLEPSDNVPVNFLNYFIINNIFNILNSFFTVIKNIIIIFWVMR